MCALTAAGERVLALHEGRSARGYPRPADRGDGLTLQLLTVADLRVSLTLAARERGSSISWQAEPSCWFGFRSRLGDELLKPDTHVEVDADVPPSTSPGMDRSGVPLPETTARLFRVGSADALIEELLGR